MRKAQIITLDENVRRLFDLLNLPPILEGATHMAILENGEQYYMVDTDGDLGEPEMINVPIYRQYQVGF